MHIGSTTRSPLLSSGPGPCRLSPSGRQARHAFQNRDVEATRVFHDAKANGDSQPISHMEKHSQASSEYLKASVFGGLDGIVTIFAIVAGCVGARLTPVKVIMIGLGNLFADALSMGFGEYVSSSAERDFIAAERAREEWEVENCPEGERKEMEDIYVGRYGFTKEDAKALVDVTSKYPTFFVNHMMVEELGLMINDDGPTPIKRGFVMFGAFCLFGLIPLVGFLGFLTVAQPTSTQHDSSVLALLVCAALSLAMLFVLGFTKGKFIGANSLKSGFLMTLNGSIAGLVSYGVGAILQDAGGTSTTV